VGGFFTLRRESLRPDYERIDALKMCGIAGIYKMQGDGRVVRQNLRAMNALQVHRGPDGQGVWTHPCGRVGLAHRRLSIIDLETGAQPMSDAGGNMITYNGEIYNYLELRDELGRENFRTTSDTEAILHAYRRWGRDCVNHLRGMFAFAIWDQERQELFCARDRFGIKPYYYAVVGETFYFASECKALLPFLNSVETDLEGFKDYLTFQFCLAGKTLFKGIKELQPGHYLAIKNRDLTCMRYWEVHYDLDWQHTARYFEDKLKELVYDSVEVHLRSDVPVGGYISGGLDSGIVNSIGAGIKNDEYIGFNGRFKEGAEFDESQHAQALADFCGFELKILDISAQDFIENIQKVIFHLDYPVAGPGSFPQFMVSQLASKYRKVVLGGQGGDEIFGGYTRYLIAYFEQCIKAAIDGNSQDGNFVVTYESIIPNLTALRNYKPLLQTFWKEGLFEEMDRRYFRLVNRAPTLHDEINWDLLGAYEPFESFRDIFYGKNVGKESYFDLMTHFDFKTLLPALLQVEDRVSMAHGLESRVPLLDHSIVEFAATIPANIKFRDGTMKEVLKDSLRDTLPESILQRTDKMGFPTPLTKWIKGEAKEMVMDVFSSKNAQQRAFIRNDLVKAELEEEGKYGRKIWGLLCLELWQQEFHDQEAKYKALVSETSATS